MYEHALQEQVLISPIFGSWREHTPTGANNKDKETGQVLGAAVWPTLATMRVDVESVVKLLRKRGDTNIYYRNGLELFSQADSANLPDGLHPDGDGCE